MLVFFVLILILSPLNDHPAPKMHVLLCMHILLQNFGLIEFYLLRGHTYRTLALSVGKKKNYDPRELGGKRTLPKDLCRNNDGHIHIQSL